MDKRPLGVYIHWPYCISKCPYCDFNSYVGAEANRTKMREAYLKALESAFQDTPNHTLQTIFFGGGTPSLMPPELTRDLIEKAKSLWGQNHEIEITLEANPATVDQDRFLAFEKAGINRLSLGIQSLDENVLKFLGRRHSKEEALEAITLARGIFPRYSFDLIYAYKDQTLESWETMLRRGLELAGGHISLYQLTIEPGTAFYARTQRGEILNVQNDLGAELYEMTGEILKDEGYSGYEISNYAKAGHESQHNLIYWRYQDYVGIGPGAHGRYKNLEGQKMGTQSLRGPDAWIESVLHNGHGFQSTEKLSPQNQATEMIMMGLRLENGIDFNHFEAEVGTKLKDFLNPKKMEVLIAEGYLSSHEDTLKLHPKGRRNLNAILQYFL
ncbi:Coproporphyrinogen III oxidase [Candidatus Bealeia paramacronuclearis]|uniref:Heme chaperone HemW n=1 Tax=Candidatus Bealeia paramacronuclearis TaxID=1921001 RepID=A0ABZ2C5G6_9PROT|nr:Coproporphyrinogen III oxidase [Candidatus Bealeia paramacronuclearis]